MKTYAHVQRCRARQPCSGYAPRSNKEYSAAPPRPTRPVGDVFATVAAGTAATVAVLGACAYTFGRGITFDAGQFPEVTTHFVVDAFERGHCDPRCFDLQKLYDTIAGLLGHGIGSTYGVKPDYGLTWGKNTIWWDNTICGGSPP